MHTTTSGPVGTNDPATVAEDSGPEFAGIDHVSLTVTDLDRSETFYTRLFGLLRLADFGHVRVLAHRRTSFVLSLIRHDTADVTPFTELNTGLDHLGFTAGSRAELEIWERRLDANGVDYTPIRDMEFGYHLNFRDPDNIALELSTPNEVAVGLFAELRDREIPRQEIDDRLREYLASRTR